MTQKVHRTLGLFKALTFLIASVSFGQKELKTRSHQVSFAMDNDFFMFQGKDGYYTNGLYFKYYKLSKKQQTRAIKKILSFGLSQMIFNAFTRKIYPSPAQGNPGGPTFIDRPITGYLFADYKLNNFYSSNSLLQFGISGGTIGKASFAREVQTSWHKETGVGDYWNWAWNYQLKSEFGLNVEGSYAVALLKNRSSFLQITPITSASLGSMLTNIQQSLLIQLGKFNQMSESTFWNSRIHNSSQQTNNKAELFFFYKPQVLCQAYNATIQGGLFIKDKGLFTSTPETFVLTHELGAAIAAKTYSVGLSAFYEGKEAKSQRYTHPYGRVSVAYRF